jgi:hypothetical protein
MRLSEVHRIQQTLTLAAWPSGLAEINLTHFVSLNLAYSLAAVTAARTSSQTKQWDVKRGFPFLSHLFHKPKVGLA